MLQWYGPTKLIQANNAKAPSLANLDFLAEDKTSQVFDQGKFHAM